jgi:hypothetical protein
VSLDKFDGGIAYTVSLWNGDDGETYLLFEMHH